MSQVSSDKPERPARDTPEAPSAGPLPWEQGRFFAQLFVGEGGGQGASRSLGVPKGLADHASVEAFAEQLVPRLNANLQWPLQAAFFLPRLGRVDVSARCERGAWLVELEAEDERTRLWLGSVQQRCQDRLSAGLGAPVHLSLVAPGCP